MDTSATSELSIEDKIKKAYLLKNEGSEHFKASNYQNAIRKYHHALLHVKGLDQGELKNMMMLSSNNTQSLLSEESKKSIQELHLICYNNLAACLLKRENFQKVIEYADKAIALEPDNTKALFRRGTAYFHLKKFCNAEDDFNKILSMNPQEKSVQKYLTAISSERYKDFEKEKQMYKKMF
eukprot:gene20152-22126_t